MEQIQVGDSKCGGGISRNGAVVSVGATTSRFDTLPEDCISMVIFHTTPRDACVVASVSRTVKSAAESDLVWEKFLPPEYSSLALPPSLDCSSKKKIYLSLADDPVLIDEGKKVNSIKIRVSLRVTNFSYLGNNSELLVGEIYWEEVLHVVCDGFEDHLE